MAIEKMLLVRASGPLRVLDEYINAVCLDQNYDPENALEYLSDSFGYERLNEPNPYDAAISAIEELSSFAGKSGDLEDISPTAAMKNRLSDTDYTAVVGNMKTHLEELYRARKEASDEAEAIAAKIDQFSHFRDLEVDLEELLACRFVKVRFGKMTKGAYARLEAYSDHPYFYFHRCETTDTEVFGLYCAPVDRIEQADRVFAALFFDRLRIETEGGTIADIVDSLGRQKEELDARVEVIDKEILGYWNENRTRISELYAVLIRLDRAFSLRKYAAVRHDSFYAVGWIPEKHKGAFKIATHTISCYGDPELEIEYAEPESEVNAEPPTKLRNPRLFRPFQYFVEMYGMPKYGSVDITPFMAITYTLLFGMMFGDLGQGLVVAAVGFFLHKKKHSPLGAILIPCGLSSAFFGLIFGSVFGYEELLDPLYHAVGLRGKPLSVMESINTVLIYAIALGVIMVTVAMCINVYTCFKMGRKGQAIFSNNGITGIVFYLSVADILLVFMGGPALIPTAVAGALAGVCAVLLFLKEFLVSVIDEGRRPEGSVGDYCMQNFFELIEYALSYFSNTVSFLRVGAFVLVHAGMMMVIFSLAGSDTNFVVIAIGNIFIIALEGLLSGIQALRLEFYEMFSRCFDGDAKPFTAAVSA